MITTVDIKKISDKARRFLQHPVTKVITKMIRVIVIGSVFVLWFVFSLAMAIAREGDRINKR